MNLDHQIHIRFLFFCPTPFLFSYRSSPIGSVPPPPPLLLLCLVPFPLIPSTALLRSLGGQIGEPLHPRQLLPLSIVTECSCLLTIFMARPFQDSQRNSSRLLDPCCSGNPQLICTPSYRDFGLIHW